jgi:hypothetical protein
VWGDGRDAVTDLETEMLSVLKEVEISLASYKLLLYEKKQEFTLVQTRDVYQRVRGVIKKAEGK